VGGQPKTPIVTSIVYDSLSSSPLFEIDTTGGFLTSRSIRKVFYQLLIPTLTPFDLLEGESGFELVTQLVDTGKRASSRL
jgi:hypothetical protein